MDHHFFYADVAELADALDLGSSSREWGFKSLHPHHKKPCKMQGFFVVEIYMWYAIQKNRGAYGRTYVT